MLLSICTILRDEEEFLPEFLDCVMDYSSDLVLVDTGSVDRSRQIIEERGLQCHEFEWVNHFSKARNYSLSLAQGEWILVLDVDDRIHPKTFDLLNKHLPEIVEDGLYFPYISVKTLDWRSPSREVLAVQTRLMAFRNGKGYGYKNPVHEKIDTVIEAMGGRFQFLDSPVFHLGYVGELNQQKADRNRKLILSNYETDPENYNFILNYVTAIWSKSIEVYTLLSKAFRMADMDGQHLAAQRVLQWKDEFQIDQFPDLSTAEEWETSLLKINPSAAYVHLRRGRKHFKAQEVRKALDCYQTAKKGLEFELSSVEDRREILDRLGVLSAMTGDFEKAMGCFKELESVFGRTTGSFHQILKLLFAAKNYPSFISEIQKPPGDLPNLAIEKRKELLRLLQGLRFKGSTSLEDAYLRSAGLKQDLDS
jgi:glycosyltransferase involved in cell wall biosynthesis